ncbi:molybdenum cofactor biosynthesis protein MoaE [Sulfitobacter donghicola]|uniref:Molybdopterin synthase catalytic subunit n=1 Tax=Sulfitobacter donghicola DSW-25 = KCTC 12864 = JCM 14565 TaxID=1300350 RepID=A0A073IGQ0_9RHOB|nr:molybdenum cofactor biosynthesis protein MoaE [Sulfitobacter donghicola]KEJ88745.1 molybdenum cofactor biosynthesis protein MoaE [Sulfitobacter donghicola DSW-25 = KCTC 12864 = JCM 14565]
MRVSVQSEPFDLGQESTTFASGHRNMGAIVTFTGIVRDLPDDPMDAMEIEHYPGMTEKAIATITKEAIERFSLGDALVIHRHGRLHPGEMIMMVATAARHRKDAFEAATYLMDYLKSRAPFWKRELSASGAAWVAAKDEDEAALERW